MVVVVDSGPLWSFALVQRLPLLGERLAGRVAWTTAVHGELERNSRRHEILRPIFTQDWLPEPTDIDVLGLTADAFRIRASIAAPSDHARAHLGESESIALAKHLQGSTFLVEDSDAARRSGFEGVHTIRTTDILAEMVVMGETTTSEAWTIYELLSGAGRLPKGWRPNDLFR